MTNIAKELFREAILTVSVCSGPYDSPHRCSALHCDHCGLCDASEDLIKVYNDYLVATLSQLEGELPNKKGIRKDERNDGYDHETYYKNGWNNAIREAHAIIKKYQAPPKEATP